MFSRSETIAVFELLPSGPLSLHFSVAVGQSVEKIYGKSYASGEAISLRIWGILGMNFVLTLIIPLCLILLRLV